MHLYDDDDDDDGGDDDGDDDDDDGWTVEVGSSTFFTRTSRPGSSTSVLGNFDNIESLGVSWCVAGWLSCNRFELLWQCLVHWLAIAT